jgi:phospholipid/cholesterol/gamma-HCH transport system substrate-binding protein
VSLLSATGILARMGGRPSPSAGGGSASGSGAAARLAGKLPRRVVAWVAATVALAFVASAVALLWPSGQERHATAYFAGAVGIVPGSDVRILGVRVGTVTAVQPQGTVVRVDLSWDAKYPVPAGAKAAVVAPAVVSDRYVQLLPAYTGGPTLADGATIPRERTATPVELDRVFSALDDLSVALGPTGANSGGALTRLLQTSAANLRGQGAAVHSTVTDLSQAMSTLDSGRQDLFATIGNLQKFTATLAADDPQVRTFNAQLASVSDQLSGERGDLAAALHDLSAALEQVTAFVQQNQAALHTDIGGLAQVTGVLARQRDALARALDVAPTALSDLQLAYNPSAGTLDTRMDAQQLADPALFVCSLLTDLGQPQSVCPTVGKAFAGLPAIPAVPLGTPDPTLGGILPRITGGRP